MLEFVAATLLLSVRAACVYVFVFRKVNNHSVRDGTWRGHSFVRPVIVAQEGRTRFDESAHREFVCVHWGQYDREEVGLPLGRERPL